MVQAPDDDGIPLQANADYILKNKKAVQYIDVLVNDSVHVDENFKHETEINASGNSGVSVPTLNANSNQWTYFYWFQTVSGSSQFTTLDTGAISEVTFEEFQFSSEMGIFDDGTEDCPGDIMAWAVWGGGVVTITNDFGVTEFTNVTFIGGAVIDYQAQHGYFGKARGTFQSDDGALVFVLPEFDGTLASQTVEGSGLLEFTQAPSITIASPPSEGKATVVTTADNAHPVVRYEPDATALGVDAFTYQVMTQLGDSATATVEIGTMDLAIFELGGRELSEQEESDPGLFLPVNADDDLAKLMIRELAPAGLKPLEGYFTLEFDSSLIQIWHNKDKTKPDHRDSAQVISVTGGDQPTRIYIDDPKEDFVLWVEGTSWGNTSIDLTWHGTGGNAVYDSVGVWVVGIDLQVDSDNNGIIEGSDWEEYLESHEFALGKLIYEDNIINPITNSRKMEPAIIRLPKQLPLSLEITLSSRRVEGRSTGTMRVKKLVTGKILGTFSFPGSEEIIGTFSLEEIGYKPETGEIKLWLQPTNYTGVKSKAVADAEGKPDNRLAASLVIPDQMLPEISDEVKLLVVRKYDFYDRVQNLQHLRSAGAAEAVYSPAGDAPTISLDDAKIFTMRYIDYEEMEAILENDPMSALREYVNTIMPNATEQELEEQFIFHKGLVKRIIRSYLYNQGSTGPFPSKDPSFQAGLYRDYVNGGYALSMRGTEPGQGWQTAADWLQNFQQAYGLNFVGQSYENGILLGWAVSHLDKTSARGGLRLTGHSLGGGIASAATVAISTPDRSFNAEVFNAAGVNQATLFRADGVTPIIPGITPGNALNSTLIDNYLVWHRVDYHPEGVDVPDILSFLQLYISWIPGSPGQRKHLEGLFNLPINKSINLSNATQQLMQLAEPAGWTTVPWFSFAVIRIINELSVGAITKMVNSHGFDSIYFGLLHDDKVPWNAYDGQPPRTR